MYSSFRGYEDFRAENRMLGNIKKYTWSYQYSSIMNSLLNGIYLDRQDEEILSLTVQ